jgi:hypothetical protein
VVISSRDVYGIQRFKIALWSKLAPTDTEGAQVHTGRYVASYLPLSELLSALTLEAAPSFL